MIHPEHQRRAYLEALGIDVWLPRDHADPEAPAEAVEESPGEPLDWEALGESSLRGHLKNESGKEESGSSAYVPREKEKDLQLKAAIDLLYGREVKAKIEGETAEPATSNN